MTFILNLFESAPTKTEALNTSVKVIVVISHLVWEKLHVKKLICGHEVISRD